MSQLKGMFQHQSPIKFGRSFAAACAIAASLGVALTASGNAQAQEYSRSSGVMPAQMVKVLDVRAMSRSVEDQRSSYNVSRIVGGALGGFAGNKLFRDQGNGTTVGTILGAAFGAAMGDSLDKSMSQHQIPVAEITFSRAGDPNGRVYVLLQDFHEGLKDCAPGSTAVLLNEREVSRCIVAPGNFARQQPVQPAAPTAATAPATEGALVATGMAPEPAEVASHSARPATSLSKEDIKGIFDRIVPPPTTAAAPQSELKVPVKRVKVSGVSL